MEESTQIQVGPPAFTGASREVDPGACFGWLRQGWLLFIANPGTWIGSAVLMMVIVLGVQIVPVFGQIAVSVLLPVFAGGLLLLSQHQHADGNAEIADLFAGFHHNAGGLVMIGVYFATGIFGIAFLAFMLVSGGVLGGVITGRIAGFGIAIGGFMIASLLVFVLSIPVLMATWFAPALVFFHDMQPLPAMKASLAAGVKNWLAMLIFALLLTVAMFFAALPFFVGFLLLIPIFNGAIYASYLDIFEGT